MTRGLPVPIWRALSLLRRVIPARAPDATATDALVRRLAATTEPIKVGFVVCSPAKWSVQTLFKALEADTGFAPAFYPTLSDTALRLPAAERAAEYAATRAFFGSIGPVARDLYDPDTDRMQHAHAIDADVVFIQQPWGMQDLPRQLSHRALPAYLHYGYPVIRNDRMQFGLPAFHPFLWCHFVPDQTLATDMINSDRPQAHNLPVTGHPKLDAFLTPAPARDAVIAWPHAPVTTRKRVIFAPHHAHAAASLNLATFSWSAMAVLALARTHTDIDFVLKPHPNLAYEMRRADAALGAVYQQFMLGWANLPNTGVTTGGAYFDLFRTSDVMITDSGSFLVEYLPTHKPLIRLTKAGAADLTTAGKLLAEGFYTADTPENLNAVFAQIVIHADDPLAAHRAASVANLLPDDTPSAQRVVDYLRAALRPASPNVGSTTPDAATGR